MTFSNFANLLKPIIGGSDNTSEFARKLFMAMIGENNSIVIEDLSDESFKAYFNGRTSIIRIAKTISPYADPENFVAYLDTFGDSVSQKLCEAFSANINDINLQNANEKIAYYFDEIIKTATENKRKNSSKKDESIKIPSKQTSNVFPYIETDKDLLTEFTSDYDQIMLNLIGDKYTSYLIDMSIPNKVKELYQTKWAEKSNDFVDSTLKSYIFGLLGTLDELSTNFMSCNSNTALIKNQRLKVRNLYVKLHPETYDKAFPYDILLDDWNDNDF